MCSVPPRPFHVPAHLLRAGSNTSTQYCLVSLPTSGLCCSRPAWQTKLWDLHQEVPFQQTSYFCCAEVSNFRTGNENLPSHVIWSQCGLTMPSFRALRMNQGCFRTKEKNCHYCQKCWEGYTGAKAIVPLTSMATQSNCGSQNCSFISPECVQAVAPCSGRGGRTLTNEDLVSFSFL